MVTTSGFRAPRVWRLLPSTHLSLLRPEGLIPLSAKPAPFISTAVINHTVKCSVPQTGSWMALGRWLSFVRGGHQGFSSLSLSVTLLLEKLLGPVSYCKPRNAYKTWRNLLSLLMQSMSPDALFLFRLLNNTFWFKYPDRVCVCTVICLNIAKDTTFIRSLATWVWSLNFLFSWCII